VYIVVRVLAIWFQEEDEILHIDELSNALKGPAGLALSGSGMPQRPEEILQSTTDQEEWNLEVERVAPQLKVTVRVDARDWRTHLEQVSSNSIDIYLCTAHLSHFSLLGISLSLSHTPIHTYTHIHKHTHTYTHLRF
jgi:hypothetical protein